MLQANYISNYLQMPQNIALFQSLPYTYKLCIWLGLQQQETLAENYFTTGSNA